MGSDYCARGEAENRIGEQFELFADRASSATGASLSASLESPVVESMLFWREMRPSTHRRIG
jgi:hypothetical protein